VDKEVKEKDGFNFFDNITAIIFVASLSEYDQEEKGKNRMEESLQLFEGICSLPWFKDTPVILFLTKKDILKEKLKKIPLTKYFHEYNGGEDWEKAGNFIRSLYEKRRTYTQNLFYPHLTCAIDPDNMKVLIQSTMDICSKRTSFKPSHGGGGGGGGGRKGEKGRKVSDKYSLDK